MRDEIAIIGALLTVGTRARDACLDAGLRAEHFADPRCAAAWSIAVEVDALNIDAMLALARERRQSKLVTVEWLADASDAPSYSPAHTAREIRRQHSIRQVRFAAREILQAAEDPEAQAHELRDKAQALLVNDDTGSKLLGPVEAADAFVRTVSDAAKAGGLRPVPTGLEMLDGMLGGGLGDPFEHEYVVLGARPGMGKTSFLISMALNIGVPLPGDRHVDPSKRRPLIPVLFHSLEQSAFGVMMRAAASRHDARRDRIARGCSSESDMRGVINLADEWSRGNVTMGLDSGATPERVYSETMRWWDRQARAGHERGVVFIDHMAHMVDQHTRDMRRAVTAASIRIFQIAKRSDRAIIPILVSQLNRGVEDRPNKRPIMRDLREAGGLEEDASRVLFLFRMAYYMRLSGQHVPPEIDCAGEVILAKSRNGATGTAIVGFDGRRTQWRNLDRGAQDAYRRKIGASRA